MNIERYGPDSGIPCLWVHGWLGDGSEGKLLQDILGDTFQLICPDLPGHGQTPLEDWTFPKVLQELALLAHDCEAAMGYSMGGRFLMMAAAKAPLSFQQLVIESSHPGLQSEKERIARKQVDAQRSDELMEKGLCDFCDQWYSAPMWAGLTPPERKGDSEQLAGALRKFGLSHQPDLRPWLRTTRNRLLWLAGSKDQPYVDHARWVRSNTTHQVEWIDAGHNVHGQCSEQWAESVRHFLV